MKTTCYLVFAALMLQGAIAAEPAADKHLFILSGQSNMRSPLDDVFRDCVEQIFGKDQVIVAVTARPSQPIKRWHKGWQPPPGMTDEKPADNGTLYQALMKTVERQRQGAPLASATFVWMQGEADAGKAWGPVYEQSFLAIIDQLKRDLKVDAVNFVVGRINDFWVDKDRFPDGVFIRQLQQKLGDTHAHGAWIDTDDLNRGVNPWGGFSFNDGHFPPPGYRVMGQRFAKAACRLIDPKLALDPTVFREQFFDGTDDVASHLAIGTTVTGPQPAAGTLDFLVDGKYGKPDHADVAWLHFAPSDQPIELIVDLGTSKTIESIAVNTLLSSAASAEFPDKVVYSTSEDGVTYTVHNKRYNNIQLNGRLRKLARGDGPLGPESLLLLTEQQNASARYLKIEIFTGKQTVLIDEIIVNPQLPTAN